MFDKIDRSLLVTERGLDASGLRQKVLSNNLANIDTPNFKGSDVSFYSTLKGIMDGDSSTMQSSLALSKTNPAHLDGSVRNDKTSNFSVIQSDGVVRGDGNNVNIDVEMAKMAENSIYYNTLATVVAKKYKMLDRAIIKGGE